MARQPSKKNITSIVKFIIQDYGTSYWLEFSYHDILIVKNKEESRELHEIAFKISKSNGRVSGFVYDDEDKLARDFKTLIPQKIVDVVNFTVDKFKEESI